MVNCLPIHTLFTLLIVLHSTFSAHRRWSRWWWPGPLITRVLSQGLPLEAVHRVPRTWKVQLPHHRLLELDILHILHFAYGAYFISYFAPCPQVQLPHDRLLVLDGHHRPGPDVQEADPTDSQGGRPEVENLKMCGLHAPASRDNVGAWCSHAKILQQASRLEKGKLYTQDIYKTLPTKKSPPKHVRSTNTAMFATL